MRHSDAGSFKNRYHVVRKDRQRCSSYINTKSRMTMLFMEINNIASLQRNAVSRDSWTSTRWNPAKYQRCRMIWYQERKRLSQYDTIQAKSYHSNKIRPRAWQQRDGRINNEHPIQLRFCVHFDKWRYCSAEMYNASSCQHTVPSLFDRWSLTMVTATRVNDQCCAATPTLSTPPTATQYEWLIEYNA